MKGEVTLTILERLSDNVAGVGELFEVFFSASKGSSYRKLRSLRRRTLSSGKSDFEKVARRQFHSLMQSLREDGILTKKEDRGMNIFNLTGKGREKLTLLRKRKKEGLYMPHYSSSFAEEVTIISFDIPERERRKRHWLRSALKNLGFILLHKSVWLGKRTIPVAFLEDLKRLRLISFVHIFSITKKGSLRIYTNRI